ncbi:hypothetical protein GH714_009090 [Hevea brasiliensis]|uniref:NADP-dependent oxidoreductase domain-containing protein n=1 Tax=Hevea brasiliensis TaxID=3981 RepID=A0A6A6NG98_HEVBR|nr:hypothetical protein GH714_009090 [Hevea brasiliensis]
MAEVGVKRIKLGSQGLKVSAQGLGCMSMSAFYGPPKPESDMIALIHHAINSGVTFLDTADIYGPHTNEILLGKALKGEMRKRVELATKFALVYKDGKWEARGIQPIRAHAVHPITAVQLEWSLWSRDVEEEIVPTCRELGIGIVAYSPLGRGFLSSGPKLLETLSEGDTRKFLPRFELENLEHNKHLFERICEIAARKQCTPSQLALAWVHHQGGDVCPIPGTTKVENFNQNIAALSVNLTPEDMAELECIASASAVKGDRYGGNILTYKDSDTPPLSSWKAV